METFYEVLIGAVGAIFIGWLLWDKLPDEPTRSQKGWFLVGANLIFLALSYFGYHFDVFPAPLAVFIALGVPIMSGVAFVYVSIFRYTEPPIFLQEQPKGQTVMQSILRSPARFEHTHILGAPGAGKTELLKELINEDIETNAAVIVMAPKGNLIRSLAKLTAISQDRLILVEPDDHYPIALNLFGMGDSGQAVSLLNYVFSSILESETTSKQTALLNYSIRLLLRVPNATLLTLRDVLGYDTLPLHFHKYVQQLSESGKHFFNHQFPMVGKDGYKETKVQVRWRLDLLLENPIIEKMFCQPEMHINMKDVMAGGKVLLIDTSIKKLGDFGSSFFGRYFIALIALAAEQRDTNHPLRSVYVYIDEASTYLTDYLETLLDRAREAKVGLTLAHQHLKQLTDISTKLEASMLNCAIKFVGRCNDHDAKKMATEIGLDPMYMQRQPPLRFVMYALNRTYYHNVHAGHLETLPQRTDRELQQLIAANRERYSSSHITPLRKAAEPEAKYTPDPETGWADE